MKGAYRAEQITYFIEAKRCGLIKIGTTRDVDNRFRCLCTQNPDELVLLGLIPASLSDGRGVLFGEFFFHRALARYRHHGEWFRATPEVREHIRHQIGLAAGRRVRAGRHAGQPPGGIGMTAPRVLTPAEEAREIHQATCRARRQGLICSTCARHNERAERMARAGGEGR